MIGGGCLNYDSKGPFGNYGTASMEIREEYQEKPEANSGKLRL